MTLVTTPAAELEPLEDLARQANEAHRNAVKAGQSMISYAMESGSYLLAAKEQCAHGEWLPWLAENFEGSQPQAFRYMKVAANYSHVNSLPPETSLRGALAAIAEAKAPEVTAEVVRDDPPEPEPEILDAEVVEAESEEDRYRRHYLKASTEAFVIEKSLNAIRETLGEDLGSDFADDINALLNGVTHQVYLIKEGYDLV